MNSLKHRGVHINFASGSSIQVGDCASIQHVRFPVKSLQGIETTLDLELRSDFGTGDSCSSAEFDVDTSVFRGCSAILFICSIKSTVKPLAAAPQTVCK